MVFVIHIFLTESRFDLQLRKMDTPTDTLAGKVWCQPVSWASLLATEVSLHRVGRGGCVRL